MITPASLPRKIDENGYDAIETDSIADEESATSKGGQAWQDFQADIDRQNLFLDAFYESFSVRRSLLRSDATYSMLTRWRSRSISFVRRWNEIIDLWYDEIYTSAALRAVGTPIEDEDTGKVSFHGADTRLTAMFLKSMYPDEFAETKKVDLKSSDGSMSPAIELTDKQRALLDKVLDDEF